jgi:hypothetical protein
MYEHFLPSPVGDKYANVHKEWREFQRKQYGKGALAEYWSASLPVPAA